MNRTMLTLLALLLAAGLPAFADGTAAPAATTIWVDNVKGDDAFSGRQAEVLGKDGPVRTFARAMKLLPVSGTLHIVNTGVPYKESLVFAVGGTPEKPLVVEGNGAVIDLGTDVGKSKWVKQEDGFWKLLEDHPRNTRPYQASPMFIDNRPVMEPHAKLHTGLPEGMMRYDEKDGRIVVNFPKGKEPGNCRIVLTGPTGACGVQISGQSYIAVRNLITRFVGNDGFNIHGDCRGIRFERVRALYSGDQGISAHETAEVDVLDAEVAYNGSRAGGVVDINNSVTTYTRCLVHHNRNGSFNLGGAKHIVKDCLTFANDPEAAPKASEKISVVNSFSLDRPETLPPDGEARKALEPLMAAAAKVRQLSPDAFYEGLLPVGPANNREDNLLTVQSLQYTLLVSGACRHNRLEAIFSDLHMQSISRRENVDLHESGTVS